MVLQLCNGTLIGVFFYKMGQPRPLFIRVRTHALLTMSCLPKALDEGSLQHWLASLFTWS